jgi:hypothetical protein
MRWIKIGALAGIGALVGGMLLGPLGAAAGGGVGAVAGAKLGK